VNNIPNIIQFEDSGTITPGSYYSTNTISVNVTANLTEPISNITINLYNITGLVNFSDTSNPELYVLTSNFAGLSDGLYYFNASVFNTTGLVNSTATRNVTIDTTYPLITIGTVTSADYANTTINNIYFNVSATETYEANITFNLYNSSGIYNSTTSSSGARNINWTSLPNGVYNYNATITDKALLKNYTSTRVITLDNTAPVMVVVYPINNSVYYANQSIIINFNATDAVIGGVRLWYNFNETTNNTYTNVVTFNYTTTGLKNLTLYTNDSLGNLATTRLVLNITNLPASSFISNDSTYNISSSITNIVVPYNSSLQSVTLTNTTQLVSFDLSQLMSNNNVTIGANNFTLVTQGTYNYTAFIPAGTVISGVSGWDGKINLPIINSTTFTAPTTTGYTNSVNVVIDMGSSGEVNFSTPVKVIIGGMSGKSAAWSRGSTSLAQITTLCNSGNSTNLTSPTNINASVRECYINSGSDLVIWTLHFTSFAAYTSTADSDEEEDSSSGGTDVVSWYVTYYPLKSELNLGYARELLVKNRVQFKVGTDNHYVGLISLTATQATINVSSKPQQAVFNIGDEKKFDVNADNYYDVLVRLNNITNIRASVTIKTINEKMPESINNVAGNNQAADDASDKESERSLFWPIFWIVVIVVVAGVSIYFVYKDRIHHKRYYT